MKINKILIFILSPAIVFSDSGYDHGTSAGKGNFDFSFTINPFNKIDYGQSYLIYGYGINDRLDFHGYISHQEKHKYNYYLGLMYQFMGTKFLDLSTAFGIRNYNYNSTRHFFFPQLLYSIHINNKTSIRGSFVNLRAYSSIKNNLGTSKDISLKREIYRTKNIKVTLSLGFFDPVLWKPNSGNWYPTYSIDFNIKK